MTPIHGRTLAEEKSRMGEQQDDWAKNSITQSYYRLRVADRDAHVQNLSKDDRSKLEQNEKKIRQTRARLQKSDEAKWKFMLKSLETSFLSWREAASKKPDTAIKHPLEDRTNHMYQLNELGADLGMEPEPDPAKEFKAGLMHFKRSRSEPGAGWKGDQKFPYTEAQKEYYGNAKFPDQKVSVHDALYNENHNPFKPISDQEGGQLLKYIHFPANNMEVRPEYIRRISYRLLLTAESCFPVDRGKFNFTAHKIS